MTISPRNRFADLKTDESPNVAAAFRKNAASSAVSATTPPKPWVGPDCKRVFACLRGLFPWSTLPPPPTSRRKASPKYPAAFSLSPAFKAVSASVLQEMKLARQAKTLLQSAPAKGFGG